MKKKIAILGSTGSIGRTLLNIISKDKKNFEIVLLTANKNYKTLFKQANEFKVKNLILTNSNVYKSLKNKNYPFKVNIFNSFEYFNKIFNEKIDYVMSSIVGVQGLEPTYIISWLKSLYPDYRTHNIINFFIKNFI